MKKLLNLKSFAAFSTFGLLFWYACFRWTWLEHLWWMYLPANLATAFASVFLLIIAVGYYYMPIIPNNWVNSNTGNLFIFLYTTLIELIAFRNIYYTVEDVIDLYTDIYKYTHTLIPLSKLVQQVIFVGIDVWMLAWCIIVYAYIKFNVKGK